jgi:hypothetical protein
MMPLSLRLLLAALLVSSSVVHLCPDARAEAPGAWRFPDDPARPVKLIVLGGSVSAWPNGSFSDWVGGVCGRVEVQNRGQAKLTAQALRARFDSEVVKNRRLKVADRVARGEEVWLLFMAGLNSIGNPESTNIEVTKTFARAHAVGLKVMGLSPNPWGAESDRRWGGVDGLAYLGHTRRVVDHFLGKLDPATALGRHAEGRTSFSPAERADVAVDLWDSTLRDRGAPPRDAAKLAREAKRSTWLKAQLKDLAPAEAEARQARLLAEAAALPTWFMPKRFHSFDAIHPNTEGHREIARAICARAPASWGCDCALLDGARWEQATRKVVPGVAPMVGPPAP